MKFITFKRGFLVARFLGIIFLLVIFSGCEKSVNPDPPLTDPALYSSYLVKNNWHDIATPYDVYYSHYLNMGNKGRAYWYAEVNELINVSQLFGKTFIGYKLKTLNLFYNPEFVGAYTSKIPNTSASWAGCVTNLRPLDYYKMLDDFPKVGLEMWLGFFRLDENVKVYLEIGSFNEDVFPDGILNSEDINNNYILDEVEDTGLDLLMDHEEFGYFPSGTTDPSFDNFSDDVTTSSRFVNNTEGNSIPDSEDLNNNGVLDTEDIYYGYELNPLNDSTFVKYRHENGWTNYLIDLSAYSYKHGDVTPRDAQSVRFVFKGAHGKAEIRIAELKFVELL